MYLKTLLLVITVAVMSSCSSTYRSGQTPDDVYYSPVRVSEEDSHNDKEEDKSFSREDRQIRMSVYDRRWRDFNDDYNYRYDPYNYGYNYGYYYNPYYCPYPVYISSVTIKNPKNTVPRMTNLGGYNTGGVEIQTPKYGGNTRQANKRTYSNSNDNNSLIRRILNSSDNNSNSNNRTYSPSSSGSSSGSSSSGSSGGSISRPSRGN